MSRRAGLTVLGALLLLAIAPFVVLPLLPEYHHWALPDMMRTKRYAGHWKLYDDECVPEFATGRQALSIVLSHGPPDGGSNRMTVSWNGVSQPVRARLREPDPEVQGRVGVFLEYERPLDAEELPTGLDPKGFFVHLFTDGPPDDEPESDHLSVDLRTDEFAERTDEDGSYRQYWLEYVRVDS